MNKIVTPIAAIACAAGSTAYAQNLLDQPYDGITDSFVASEGIAGGFYDTRGADNFSNPMGLTVTEVSFWGADEGFFSPDGLPTNVASFVVEIFADSGGVPGSSVASESIAFGDAAATDTGDTNFGGSGIFRFDLDIADVALAPGDYWVAIGATPVTDFQNDDSFFWALSNSGDGTHAEEFPALSGTWDTFGDNLAVSVTGIPAPGAAGLLGFAGLAAARRRR